MKKILSLTMIVAIMLFVLTGCVNVNYEVTLNKDGSADVSYVYGFEKATLQQLGTTADSMTSDMKKNAEESEYTIESYSDDEMEGFKASKHVENLSEISLEEAFGASNVKDSEENQFKIEKKGGKTVYSQNANIDLSSMDSSTASMVAMKYTVKLPVKVSENNADEVSKDGKTLTWNLKAGETNEINFKATSGGFPVVAVVIVIAVIAAACVVYVVLKNSKKNDKEVKVEVKKPVEKEEVKEEPKKEAKPEVKKATTKKTSGTTKKTTTAKKDDKKEEK